MYNSVCIVSFSHLIYRKNYVKILIGPCIVHILFFVDKRHYYYYYYLLHVNQAHSDVSNVATSSF